MKPVIKGSMRMAILALATLIATPAVALHVDPKGEKELTAAGQRVDKVSASAESGQVTGKIVDQWKGTQFTFDKGTTPRELTAKDVQDYRAKGLGYGEISILLALAAKQDGTSPKSVNEILAMRQDKMGWGNIAKELGYKSLGSVNRSVKATETAVERASASGKAEKVSKVDKSEKQEKAEKFEKPERVRVEKPERPEKPGR
jgi:hypothetical protein